MISNEASDVLNLGQLQGPSESKHGRRQSGLSPKAVFTTLSFMLLGISLIVYPLVGSVLVGVAIAIGLSYFLLRYVDRLDLDIWQILVLTALSGYIVLNYGFENIALHVGGIPVIVSYAIMYASLLVALFSCRRLISPVFREPTVLCLVALLVMAFLHLLRDIPIYGIWAIRDATMFTDGVFLLLGFLWGRRKNSVVPLMRWFTVILLINLLYSFTLPWRDAVNDWSPKSGVFHETSVFGNYGSSAEFLLLGALFFMYLAPYVLKWPRWILLSLALFQIMGLAILQARAMYVGLVIAFLVLLILGNTKKSAKFLFIVVSAAIAVMVMTTVFGVQISGRIGPVNLNFIEENARSLTGARNTPGADIQDRFSWYDEVFARIKQNPILGEGFGRPLIDYQDLNGADVRQPHNSSISVLARLGFVGLFFWLMFHVFFLARFTFAYRRRHTYPRQLQDFLLWLLIVYIVLMIDISVQPGLEFPSGAVPFYFFVGLMLGLIRYRVPVKVPRLNVPVRQSLIRA